MRENFRSSLEHVLRHEGGFSDHPDDPGGATNKGVTLATFRRYYGESMGVADLQAITNAQLEHIYKTGYWDTCRCDDLPAGIDYVVFDQAVNSGPGRSARWLQAAVGAEVDGKIGPKTVAAAKASDACEVIERMCDDRLEFLRGLRHWPTFGTGWTRRVADVRKYGLQLCGAEALTPEPGARAPSTDYRVVRLGSQGPWVERLQEALGVEVDGLFGPATKAALEAFQAREGLEADGIAGRNTYRALGLLE